MTLSCAEVRDLAAGFVLGALQPDEDSAVREHLATCQDAHAEVAALGGVVPYLAESLEPVEPPAGLRARLLAAAAAERPAESAEGVHVGAQEPAGASEPVAFPSPGEREARQALRGPGWGTWALRLAAVFVIAALGTWNIQLQARLSGVSDDLAAAQAYQAGVAAVLEVATRSGAQTAFLAAADPATTAAGVAAAAPDGTVVLAMHDLARTTGNQVYEAWVIIGEAAPVPLGGFTVGAGGTGTFHASTGLAQPGAILALTLEPAPGATTPTLPVLTLGSLAVAGT